MLEEYEIKGNEAATLYTIRSPYQVQSNYQVEADGHWTYGNNGAGYGIVFGISENFSRFYVFETSPNISMFHLIRYENGDFEEVLPWEETDLLKSGSESNHLLVKVNTGSITLDINGETVGSWSDDLLNEPTYAGLATSSRSNYDFAQALFDNFSIRAISGTIPAQIKLEHNISKGYLSPTDNASYRQFHYPIEMGR